MCLIVLANAIMGSIITYGKVQIVPPHIIKTFQSSLKCHLTLSSQQTVPTIPETPTVDGWRYEGHSTGLIGATS